MKDGTATITAATAAIGAGADSSAGPRPAGSDRDPVRWLADLRGPEPARSEAVGRLRAMLLGAAEFEVARRRRDLSRSAPDAPRRIARAAAESALVDVLERLDDFRGESRFSTWAAKFALLEAAVMVRISAWDGRALPGEPQAWARLTASGGRPADGDADDAGPALRAAMVDALSGEERAVIVALALNGVPIDVLAHRLGTTRDALYETLRTARRRLRARLGERGAST